MSWLITTSPPSCADRNERSQVIESASRWFVGSSSSSVVALGAPPPAAVRGREQDPGELDAAALAARERLAIDWLSTRSGSPRCAQIRAASLSAAYPPSAANRSSMRPYSRTAPSFCAPSTSSAIAVCAFSISRSSWSSPRAESTRSLAVTVRSPSRGVLRQVADRAARGDRARVRLALAGEHPHRGGLAGAVAADEADPVARLHAQRGAGQQDAGPGTQFQVGRGDHRAPDG